MRKYFGTISLLFILGCSGTVRNTNMVLPPNSGGKSGAQANCTSSSLFLDGVQNSSSSVPWIGGTISYKWYKYEISLSNPPEVEQSCSAIFEFSKPSDKYRVKITTSDACTDSLSNAKDAVISVWNDPSSGYTGGYREFYLKNQNFEKYLSIMKGLPEGNEKYGNPRAFMTDIVSSGQLVPLIQSDISVFISEDRATDAALFCGTSEEENNDSPTPKNCVWPQGMQVGEYEVETYGDTKKADIDELVKKSSLFRVQRMGSKSISAEAKKAVTEYLAELENAQRTSMKARHWAWLNRVLTKSENGNGPSCDITPERRAACARVATKFLIPEKSQFVESAIAAGFPETEADIFNEDAEKTAFAQYAVSLDALIRKWKVVLKFMEKEKGALRLVANLPTSQSLSEFQAVPLFGKAAEVPAILKGAHWSFKTTYLALDFDNSQVILRRPMDTGAIVLLGDLPVLALLRNAPQSDGAGSLVLPVPQKISSPDCPK